MAGAEAHGVRLDRVETQVETFSREMSGLKSDMAGVKADVRGLGSILTRIEQGIAASQQQWQDDKQASRLNPIAMGSVLLTIISILVGGAWLISGAIARQDERSIHQQRSIELVERRQWELGVSNDRAPQAYP